MTLTKELLQKELNNKENLLVMNGVKKLFPIQKGAFRRTVGQLKALDNVDLTIKQGETFGLVGESGCGKTTLGKTIVQLHKVTEGQMLYNLDGKFEDLLTLDKQRAFEVKKKIQIIFQDPYSSLNPAMTIYNSLEELLRIHGMKTKRQRKDRIAELLEAVNLYPDYMNRFPHEFSGGQRQRIGIARALCVEPELIVCDEAVSALDVSIQAQVLNLFKDLQKKMDLTYLFISHDLSVIEYISDRLAVMYLGKIVEIADSKNIYENPQHPYTQALLSAIPVPTLDRKKSERIVLHGDVPSPENPPSGCRFHPRCKHCMDICKKEEPKLLPNSSDSTNMTACHLINN